MIEQAELFADKDRFFLQRDQIDCFTVPLGDRYGDDIFEWYFAIYAGVTRKYVPGRIFEVGTRFGATAICMLLGLPAQGNAIFRSIDDESYDYDSCSKANRNFAEQVPWADAKCIHWNSFDTLHPEVVALSPYDLIHIDGNHDKHGVLNDLAKCWPLLAWNGLTVLDDATHPPIKAAIEEWLAKMAPLQDVRVRYQHYTDARGHCFLQKVAI